MRSFILFVTFAVITGSQLSAATRSERIKDCILGLLSEDEKSVLLSEMTEWKNLFSSYVVENVSACYTKITGQPSEFMNGIGLVFDSEQILDAQAAKDELAKKAKAANERLTKKKNRLNELWESEKCLVQKGIQISELQESMLELYAEENATLINDRTYTACVELNKIDPNAAILNPTCREIFAKRLHPDLPASTFSQDYGSLDQAYQRNLAQFAAVSAEIKVLKGLVPEQTKSYDEMLKDALTPCE